MALAHEDLTPEPVGDEEFAAAVRRNIKSLLAMRSMEQKDLAPLVGMTANVLSSRMKAGEKRTSWRDAELIRVADAFKIGIEVLFAMTEQDFRDALSRSRCSSETGWPRHLQVVPDPEPEPEPEPEQTELDLGDR